MRKMVILALSFTFIAPVLSADIQVENRRIEEEKRAILRPTESVKFEAKEPSPVSPANIDITYFQELLSRKVTYISDAFKVLAILTGSGEEENIDPEMPLRKGVAAYMFCKALDIKGGVFLQLFGVTPRYAMKELIYEGIMYPGDADDIVTGKELVTMLDRSAAYLSSRPAPIAVHDTSLASEQARRVEEEKRPALVKTEKAVPEGYKTFVIDYGGWSEFRYDDYRNEDNDSALPDVVDYVNSIDTRFWLKAILRPPQDAARKNVHYLYIRFKEQVTQSYSNDKDWRNKHDSPLVEYAYAVADLNPMWLQVGRHYVSVGRGIAYSDVNDAVQLFLSLPEVKLKALLARTLPHEDNIDTSVPGSSQRSDRLFYGFESAYTGIPGHNFYSFFVVQRDRTAEDPPDDLQDYDYNSEYLGLGAHGDIIKPLHYLAEIISETGTSRISPSNEKASIEAWAGVFEVAYDWELYSHPRLSCRYAFATGDKDRLSITDTINGNTSGIDRNFLYFGYILTGYALSPRLSNLHFIKGTVSLAPFEGWRPLKYLTLETSYYRYYKDKAAGAISDPEAAEFKGYIGDEIDVELSWQVASDLNCILQYGHFFTGSAYPLTTNDDEEYFSVSLALSF